MRTKISESQKQLSLLFKWHWHTDTEFIPSLRLGSWTAE